MATVLKIGPLDHSRPMTLDEFLAGDYEEGYQYELIDGKLYVAPAADLSENRIEEWVGTKIRLYSWKYPRVINYVTSKARVFVPGRGGITNPEPDLAAYRNFPVDLFGPDVVWQDVSPILVVEVLSIGDPDKDLLRNVDLYLEVPSIKEYWLFDSRNDPYRPTLRVHRRHGKKWRLIDVAFGETYTTKLLPRFKLILDPRR
jgi:Uma2 family endonuclease